MEHTFFATLCVLALSAAVVICSMALAGSFDKEEPSFYEPSEVVFSAEEKTMVLGVFEGKLALFIGKSDYPNRVFDFMIRTLPPDDQKLLSDGIKISSEEELSAILEDYMS